MQLYSYQQEAQDTILKHIDDSLCLGDMIRVLMVMATGLGKTITATSIINQLAMQDIIKAGDRILFLCHNIYILEHALEDMEKVLPKSMTLGIYNGTQKSGVSDVLFSTFQMMQNRKQGFNSNEFGIVVVDESHHGQADTFKEVIDYFVPKILFGMTATPDRMDQKDIRDIFGPELVDIPLAKGIANGWLAKARYELVMDNIDNVVLQQLMSDVAEDKTVSIDQINKTLFIKARDEEVAKKIISYQRKGIIFCENIAHAEEFVKYLPNAVTCHSRKSKEDNDQAVTDFKSGQVQFILTIDKFNEGVDVPDTAMVVFLRTTDSLTVFIQQLGRGLRLSPNKEDVIVLDFVGNCERLRVVQGLFREIKSYLPKIDKDDESESDKQHTVFHLGKHLDVLLNAQETDIWSLIERAFEKKEFYATCAEASEATKRLGIMGRNQYIKEYLKDSLLPSYPWGFYPDYDPKTFYAQKYYQTCAEASEATKRLGITGPSQYEKEYKKDPLLPSQPCIYYPDYDLQTFYAQKYYQTCAEASEAIKRLGITGPSQYIKEYKKDLLLPSKPWKFYPDYDSKTFFGKG